MSHSALHHGLQAHSIGELYPWSIVVIDNAAENRGYCVARNLTTGKTLTRREYDSSPAASEGESFELAHALAESDARKAIAAENRDRITPADVALLAELGVSSSPAAELSEYVITIPVVRDDNKLAHAIELWASWEKYLLDTFGGFTDCGRVDGAWRASNGEIIADTSRRYSVAIPDARVLLDAIPLWASRFGQQCLYVVETGRARLIDAR